MLRVLLETVLKLRMPFKPLPCGPSEWTESSTSPSLKIYSELQSDIQTSQQPVHLERKAAAAIRRQEFRY